jgi:hypothetical protein
MAGGIYRQAGLSSKANIPSSGDPIRCLPADRVGDRFRTY